MIKFYLIIDFINFIQIISSNNIFMDTVGERIEFIRKTILRISQSDLAVLLGMTQAAVSAAEKSDSISKRLAESMETKIDGLRVEWIRTGRGDVFDPSSKFKESESFIKNIQQNTNTRDNKIIVGNDNSNSKEDIVLLRAELVHKDEIIAQLKERVSSQNKQIESKDRQIESKDKQIELLSRLLEKANS